MRSCHDNVNDNDNGMAILVVTTHFTESVAESVNLDLAEILLLVGGSIPPAVPFRRRCQPVLGSLLGSVAGIHRLSHRLGEIRKHH